MFAKKEFLECLVCGKIYDLENEELAKICCPPTCESCGVNLSKSNRSYDKSLCAGCKKIDSENKEKECFTKAEKFPEDREPECFLVGDEHYFWDADNFYADYFEWNGKSYTKENCPNPIYAWVCEEKQCKAPDAQDIIDGIIEDSGLDSETFFGLFDCESLDQFLTEWEKKLPNYWTPTKVAWKIPYDASGDTDK